MRKPHVIQIFKAMYDWDSDDFYSHMDNCIVQHEDKLYYLEQLNRWEHYSYLKDGLESYEIYSLSEHKTTGKKQYSCISKFSNKHSDCCFSNNNTFAYCDRFFGSIYVFEYSAVLSHAQIDSVMAIAHAQYGLNWWCVFSGYSACNSDMEYDKYLAIKNRVYGLLNSNNINFQFMINSNYDESSSFAIGYLSWDYQGTNLFFDNSNIQLACIWKTDVKRRVTTKIVPEHDAICPFYFEFKGKPYVAYTYHNQLMVCEPDK